MAYRKLSDKYGLSAQGKAFRDVLVTENEWEGDGPVGDKISYIIAMLEECVRTAKHNYGEYEEKAAKEIEKDIKNI